MSFYTVINEWFLRKQNTAAKRTTLYKKLGVYVQNGLPIDVAMERLYVRVSQEGTKHDTTEALALRDWLELKNDGNSFAASIQSWASPEEYQIINAGEHTGRLPEAFEQLAETTTITKKLKKAVVRPLFVPVFGIAAITFFLVTINKMAVGILTNMMPMSEWVGLSLLLKYMSIFTEHFLFPVLIGLAIFGCLVKFSLPRLTGPFRRAIEGFLPYRMHRLVSASTFMLTLSNMMQARVSVDEALGFMSKSGSRWYRDQVNSILEGMDRKSFANAALTSRNKFLDEEIVGDLLVYEETTGLAEAIGTIARTWADENIEAMTRIAFVIKLSSLVFLILVAAATVGGLIGTSLQLLVYLRS